MAEKRKFHSSLYWIPRQFPDDPQKFSDIRPDSEEWASQELHLFIVTDAGKPIFTRYGTIPMVSPIMCSYYAISSLMESLHEELDHFKAGSSTFVFLRKQSFIFIAVSKSSLPVSYLFKQLHYLYLLFLSLFSKYILTQISQKPSIDFRLYAEPNRPTWNGVINNMSEDPAFIFVPYIPVSCVNPKLRQVFSNSHSLSRLQSCKLSMLIKKNRVVAFGSHICDPTSLRLIIDLVWTPVFQDEEHWVPLYLRDSNKTNFLFTHNLKGTDYYVVMLCDGNQEMDTYHSVSVSILNELIVANRNSQLSISMKKASDVFYFWALKSLTYGQVYVTDPDPKFFSETLFRKPQSSNINQNSDIKQDQEQNLTEGQNIIQEQNQNSNESPSQESKGIQSQNSNENRNTNENDNDNDSDKNNENENQDRDRDQISNENQNENQESNQTLSEKQAPSENQTSNENQAPSEDLAPNENQTPNENQEPNEKQEPSENQASNDNIISDDFPNESQSSNEFQIGSQSSANESSNQIPNPLENQSRIEAEIPHPNPNPDRNQNQNPHQVQAGSSLSGSITRQKMRYLIRQLSKSADNVESNGNDGEYMFRGEKEVIVVFKNKEMELYAVARSEDLRDEDISKKLEELKEYINTHIHELLITENKFYVEKFY